jgi:putative ABC transport system substrate-binding protein
LASELIGLKVDVIVASNSLSGRAAQQATTTIPIVVPVMGDPVADGLVANLARPGGNITGLTFLGPQLVPKRLVLLKEALPRLPRWQPSGIPAHMASARWTTWWRRQRPQLTLGLHLRFIAVQGPDELDRVFSTIAAERTDAVMVFPSPMLFTERRRIVDLAGKLRLPLIVMGKEFVELGGLMSYGADITDFIRRGATGAAGIFCSKFGHDTTWRRDHLDLAWYVFALPLLPYLSELMSMSVSAANCQR